MPKIPAYELPTLRLGPDFRTELDDGLKRLGYRETFRRAVAERFERLANSAEQIGGRIDFSAWPEYTGIEPSALRATHPLIKRVAKEAADRMREAVLLQVLLPELVDLLANDDNLDPPGGEAA